MLYNSERYSRSVSRKVVVVTDTASIRRRDDIRYVCQGNPRKTLVVQSDEASLRQQSLPLGLPVSQRSYVPQSSAHTRDRERDPLLHQKQCPLLRSPLAERSFTAQSMEPVGFCGSDDPVSSWGPPSRPGMMGLLLAARN